MPRRPVIKPIKRLAKTPSAFAQQPAIVPPGLEVTRCPSGQDTRFAFTPPAGWTGQITRDWLARRLESKR